MVSQNSLYAREEIRMDVRMLPSDGCCQIANAAKQRCCLNN